MFNQKRYYNLQQQNQPTILAKVNSSYRKLEKAMTEPPREYEQIKKKKLIEANQENIIDNIDLKKKSIINSTKKKNVKIMMNRKINNKSKKYKKII